MQPSVENGPGRVLGASRIHLLGIGGIGVSAVARLLLARGVRVSGSDVRESSITLALREEGADVTIGHSAANLAGAELVMVSSAIPETNPELVAARSAGLRVVHRSVVLGALMQGRRAIGVTGTNGKGSVSSLVAFLLDRAGLAPSFAIGAKLLDYGTNARTAGGLHLVAELDESDGSFANTRPDVLVVNNLEADHLNYYRDLDGLLDHFVRYLSSDAAPPVVVANGDDPNVRVVLERSGCRAVSFGCSIGCTYRLSNVALQGFGASFKLAGPAGDLGRFELNLPGEHNAMNAGAALACALEEGVDVDVARAALPAFRGLENRFTLVPSGACLVVKDYISHPTGIRSVLEGARVFAQGRVVAVFKPYRFSMISYLRDEYRVAFSGADVTLLTEMYTAGEVPIPGVDVPFLVDQIRSTGCEVHFVPEMDRIGPALHAMVRPGDTVVFFGGDDLFRIADRFSDELKAGGA